MRSSWFSTSLARDGISVMTPTRSGLAVVADRATRPRHRETGEHGELRRKRRDGLFRSNKEMLLSIRDQSAPVTMTNLLDLTQATQLVALIDKGYPEIRR
jgi:hypothetical protein